jgi:uncharacterized protein (DUF1684 family)
MKLKLFGIFLLLINAASAISQTEPIDDKSDYNTEIDNYRRGKNIKLMYGDATPLLPEQQKSFKGLNYFPPDIVYLVEATLVKADKQEEIIMKTSGDRTPIYIRYGVINFNLMGKAYTLAVFQNKKMLDLSQDTNSLFIPFHDETSGKESYGGGRYLDCEIPSTGDKLMIDFNKAYNPYCAYNHKYSCVIPPEENRLTVKIKAGEKVFEDN